MSPTDTSNLEPIYISVKQAADMLNITPWSIYKELKNPASLLDDRYFGKRRLITVDSVRAFGANFPTERPETVA